MPRLTTVKVILFFFLLAILEHTVLTALQIGGVYPSFLCLFVCYASIEWGAKKTIPVAFWAGLLKDLLGGGLLGVQAGIMVVAAAGLDQVVQKSERQFPGIYFLIAFIFTLVCGILNWALSEFIGGGTGAAADHLGSILGTALYTAVFFPAFDLLAGFWFGTRSLKRQYELFK